MGKDKNFVPDPNKNPFRQQGAPNYASRISPVDFKTQRICPSCGKTIIFNHNFCKFCGVDLSQIKNIEQSDQITINLAISALTDPDSEVRREAVDTLGNFKETKVLGVLTYILFNDPDENVRREACDELGDLHHPYSLNALTAALQDRSPIVRKEAVAGLKKIKEKNENKDMDKGKPKDKD